MYKRELITKDAYINSDEPYKNYGKSRQLYVLKTNKDESGYYVLDQDSEKRSLFDIDIEGIQNQIDDWEVSTVEVSFSISNHLVDDPLFSISCYPLTRSFYENYGSDVNNISNGVNWLSADEENEWTVAGGDYDDQNEIPTSIDPHNKILTVDISDYLENTLPQNHFGFILIPNGTARNFAMYSAQSDYAIPYVNIFIDDYTVDTENQVVAFDNNEIPEIVLRGNKYRYRIGETLQLKVSASLAYTPSGFEQTRGFYLPNLKYRLIDVGRNRLIVDYRDETRLSVSSKGNTLMMKLDNLLAGFYELSVKYDNGSIESYGVMEFKIEA